jgi:serine/threonine protein kinase/Tol biopolymer transport system component
MTPEPWRKAEKLYHAALEREPKERDAFLEKACAGDEALLDELKSRLGNTWVGRRVQSYEVLSLLGAGGMGEVYRAKDTKLGRDVALKVLSEEFAEDPERVTRFEREARLLAALNHPNVAAIHGLEESEGRHVLVLELVEGETLAERIGRGPIPIGEALPLFRQLAAGLEAAHEKGIVHRDLKPSNVTVTPEGQIKVLDFGLAKAFRGVVAAGSDVRTETAWESQTGEGRIVGTVSYMSPEQARGQAVDKRTDVWAFGCCLYEALTGRRPFAGGTVSDTLAAVLEREVEWERLPVGTPLTLRWLLRRCLQKDKERRLHDIADARIEIEEATTEPTAPVGVPTEALKPRRWRQTLPWKILAGLTTIVAAVSLWSSWRAGPPSRDLIRFAVNLPPGEAIHRDLNAGSSVRFSPDGTQIVYVVQQGETRLLYSRGMDALEGTPIPGTEGAATPFFSPDGRWVGFFAEEKLKKVFLQGGTPIVICDTPRGGRHGGSWGVDDTIVFGGWLGTRLWRVPAGGGTPEPVTPAEKLLKEMGQEERLWPQLLPGGRDVLYTVWHRTEDAGIALYSLDTDRQRVLVEKGSHAQYVPTGHLLYAWEGDILAAPFSLSELEVTGPSVPVLEGVATESNGGAHFSVSETGSLIYAPGARIRLESTLAWVDLEGAIEPLSLPARTYLSPRISPEGTRAVVSVGEEMNNLWLYELDRGTFRPLTDERGDDFWALWTPDGQRLVFNSNRYGGTVVNLYSMAADGNGPKERLTESESRQIPQCWLDGGTALAFQVLREEQWDIWTLPMTGTGESRALLQESFNERLPVLSPGGHWLAYVSNESGRDEVYVQAYPGPGAIAQISLEGGTGPLWAPDGQRLYYRDPTGKKVLVVSFTADPSLQVGKPRVLFEGDFRFDYPYGRTYDITPDGQRFLMLQNVELPPPPSQFNVVLNWFEELKRLVPTK